MQPQQEVIKNGLKTLFPSSAGKLISVTRVAVCEMYLSKQANQDYPHSAVLLSLNNIKFIVFPILFIVLQ